MGEDVCMTDAMWLRAKIHRLALAEGRALDAQDHASWRALRSERNSFERVLSVVLRMSEAFARRVSGVE